MPTNQLAPPDLPGLFMRSIGVPNALGPPDLQRPSMQNTPAAGSTKPPTDGTMTPADVWSFNRDNLGDAWQAAQNPDTWREAAQNFGDAMLMGSTAPGMRAFHGSPLADLTELRPSQYGPFGPATYLSPWENTAARYQGSDGGVLYDVPMPENLFHGAGSRFIPGDDVNHYQVWRDQAAKLVDAAPAEQKQAVGDLMKQMQPDDGYPFFRRLANLMGGDEAAQGLLKDAGYSGISGHVDGPEIGYFGSLPTGASAPLRRYGLAGLLGGGAGGSGNAAA